MTGLLYFLFFCSGVSGLIYQVIWVRVFGNVFGNTVYSASLVIAVFMLGLGVGSYIVGAWADRRYADLGVEGGSPRAQSLLQAYGYFELVIGLMGLGISALLPHLGQVSALVSSYVRDASGWYVLSTASYLARGAIAVVLLTPITLLMGGTLTLLIRHLVRQDVEIGGWRIAALYGVNTAGAALGCFLTDFALVPASGLRGAQLFAALLNVVAAAGALYLAKVRLELDIATDAKVRLKSDTTTGNARKTVRGVRLQPDLSVRGVGLHADQDRLALLCTSLALALSGFAAMGMEILWFRHFTILLGGFRAVFSLLLTVILIGMGAGSLVGGFLHRRTVRDPQRGSRVGDAAVRGPAVRAARWLMIVQGLFVASTLFGLATAAARSIKDAAMANPAYQAAAGRVVLATANIDAGWARAFEELWFNLRPILWEVGIPSLLMGFAFPLANAIIQRTEHSVGRRAGVLYLSNTVGAVCGSLAAGFFLLPMRGIQGSASILAIAAALAVVSLYLATGVGTGAGSLKTRPTSTMALAGSVLIGGVALGLWLRLPPDYVISRALELPAEKGTRLALSEGITEVIAVTEVPGKERTLFTNGHPMSSTAPLSQRYMRALAHIPLLSIDQSDTVLVIGFGVGNTTDAARLHPSIRRIEVADLSRHVLAHAGYFKDANKDVLNDPRVVVYVNDGRQHLQMQRPGSYDLITLEPPPIAHAGVAALYSEEFYALARTRLKPKGFMSQWLPVYQVPAASTLAMIRAFLDVFPQSVLVSGATDDLLLVGANDSRIEIDPTRVATAIANAPALQADLQRVDLGSAREIVGMFLASPQSLADATRASAPVTDDRPIQEYGVRSLLTSGDGLPASVADVSRVAAWCPTCFVDGKPAAVVEGLDTYFALLERAYRATPAEVSRTRSLADQHTRRIEGSAYLGAMVPDSADLHNILGAAFAASGKFEQAIGEFREAVRLDAGNGQAHYALAGLLLEARQYEDAVGEFRAALRLMPDSIEAHDSLGIALASGGKLDEAISEFRAALRLTPESVKARNNLGIALASQGKLDEAIEQFQQALSVDPNSADARRNLATALQRRRPSARSGTR